MLLRPISRLGQLVEDMLGHLWATKVPVNIMHTLNKMSRAVLCTSRLPPSRLQYACGGYNTERVVPLPDSPTFVCLDPLNSEAWALAYKHLTLNGRRPRSYIVPSDPCLSRCMSYCCVQVSCSTLRQAQCPSTCRATIPLPCCSPGRGETPGTAESLQPVALILSTMRPQHSRSCRQTSSAVMSGGGNPPAMPAVPSFRLAQWVGYYKEPARAAIPKDCVKL